MNKYNLEGNIDFFNELHTSLDENEDDANTCLITGEKLTDKYVTLNCNHTFNYIPLFNDILMYKNKFNYMESPQQRLHINEIRCPYCRSKQSGLLPYYADMRCGKINGVNCCNPPAIKKYYVGKLCEYQTENKDFDFLQPESSTNEKYIICSLCVASTIPIDNDYKCYCYGHKKQVVSKYNLQQKQKVKEEAKQVRLQQKEEMKKKKAELKLEQKEEMKKKKAELKLEQKKQVIESKQLTK